MKFRNRQSTSRSCRVRSEAPAGMMPFADDGSAQAAVFTILPVLLFFTGADEDRELLATQDTSSSDARTLNAAMQSGNENPGSGVPIPSWAVSDRRATDGQPGNPGRGEQSMTPRHERHCSGQPKKCPTDGRQKRLRQLPEGNEYAERV
jgi:hypothetical protein